MRLREWQQTFQNIVLGTTPIDKLPMQQKGLPPELSIGIYANAYRERLHEALRENYSALHRLLGDHDFAEMAYAFTTAHPPQTASIRWFGDALPDYLGATEPYRSCPAIAELAQFEWALRHTVDAGDGERIDAAYLQSLNAEQWESLHCDLHPSLTILHFDWNAAQVWCALDANEEPPAPAPLDSYWFIYRGSDLMSEWRSADSYEAAAIRLWARGDSFGSICESLAEKIGDAEAAISTGAAFMRAWVEQGLLIFSPLPAGEGAGVRACIEEENNVCER